MQALYGYGYGDYQAGYQPVFKHEDEVVEHPHEHRPVEVYQEPEPVYREPVVHEVYSATTGPYYESSEGYLSEDSYDSGPYSESQRRNTEYDEPHQPVYRPEPVEVAPVRSGEVFYEGEDPYVTRHEPVGVVINEPDYNNQPVYDEPSYYEPTYDEATHYAAAAPVYQPEPVYQSEPSVYYEDEDPYVDAHHEPVVVHAPVHRDDYSDTMSVYESSGYRSSYSTSVYGETSYRSPRQVRKPVQPVRNYEHVETYRPEQTYQPPVQRQATRNNGLPDQVQVNYNADATSVVGGDDNDVVINIFNGVGVPQFGRQIEYQCQPGTHECRPQCPEARYNSHDGTVTVNWIEDAAGCEHYAKPDKTLITLFAPSA